MPAITVEQLEFRKEPPDQWKRVVRNIVTLRPADHQRRTFVSRFIGVFEGEIRHRRQRFGQSVQGDSEPQLRLLGMPVLASVTLLVVDSACGLFHEVGQEELSDRDVGFVLCEDLVRFGLFCEGRAVLFDLVHRLDVGVEIRFQGSVDGRVVHGDQGRVVRGPAQGEGHGDFGAHGVADEGRPRDRVR